MAGTAPSSSPGRWRAIALIAGVVAVVAVAVGSIGFAASDQAVRVAQDALVLREAADVLGESTVLRSNVGITLVLGSAESEGLEVQDSSQAAAVASLESLERLEGAVRELEAARGTDYSEYVADVRARLEAAMSVLDRPHEADRVAREGFLPALDLLDNNVAEEMQLATGRIEAESGSAGRAAFISSLTVGLLIPALAVWIVRSIVRRKSERELLSAELKSERELTAARDELIAGLSHELRTPLTGIFGFAEALRDETNADTLDREFLSEASETIYREAGELRRMVDDLLVGARAETGDLEYHFEDVDVESQVLIVLEPFVKRGDAITVQLDPAHIRTDRLRLQHAVRNVVANAVEHGRSDVAVRGRIVGSAYRLAVTDAGPGIGPEVADRIFERFANRGQVTEGRSLGMGLAVAQTLMGGMGGLIEHRRIEGRTVFTFEIPLAPGRQPVPITGRATA